MLPGEKVHEKTTHISPYNPGSMRAPNNKLVLNRERLFREPKLDQLVIVWEVPIQPFITQWSGVGIVHRVITDLTKVASHLKLGNIIIVPEGVCQDGTFWLHNQRFGVTLVEIEKPPISPDFSAQSGQVQDGPTEGIIPG